MILTDYEHKEIRTELAKVRSAISIIRDAKDNNILPPADQMVILERAEYVIRSILHSVSMQKKNYY